MRNQKVCIIGDGLTGLTTAMVLGKLNLDINLVSPVKKNKKIIDNRTTAISPDNLKFISNFFGEKNKKLFWPSKEINLFYEDLEGYQNFLKFKKKGKNLMYIIKNNKLKEIIKKSILKNKKIEFINTDVKEINQKDSTVTIKGKKINYDLILLCVGKNSDLVKKLVGERSLYNDFNEMALTTMIKHNSSIKNTRQYFTKEGPLAILPISKNEFSLVWSVNRKLAFEIDQDLIKKKLELLLNLKGPIKLSKPELFPITFRINVNLLKKNFFVLGEGSYNIHPVAGQGFNLILRDIKKLGKELENFLSLGIQIKNSPLLLKVISERKPENLLFGMGINLIHKFFKNNKISDPVKKIILKDINKLNFLKKISLGIANKGFF